MNEKNSAPRGFSLPEALVAMLLLSVSILGLLNYYQSLTYSFMRQWQVQQAWSDAHAQLEAYSVTGHGTGPLVKGWEYQLSGVSSEKSCELVRVAIQTPTKYQAALQRLMCQPNLYKREGDFSIRSKNTVKRLAMTG